MEGLSRSFGAFGQKAVLSGPSGNGHKPDFASEPMLKDLNLALQAAAAVGSETPLGEAARDLYHAFVETETGRDRDFSAILSRFETQEHS